MRKVRCLKPGDTIAIIAPASPVENTEIQRACKIIQGRGYRVVVGDHVLDTVEANTYLAGSDENRLADLHTMFERQDVDAIFCARGGYGSMRLLDRIDWSLIRNNPKIFTGYSDITSLQLGIQQRADFVTFHGPNAVTLDRLDSLSFDQFWRMLEHSEPYGSYPISPQDLTCLVPGLVDAPLAGGCISMLAHACGSEQTPHFAGKIVALEDVNEPIYRMDRYLIQLRNAGAFDDVRGFLLGNVTNWQSQETPNQTRSNDLHNLWTDFFVPMGKPTLAGFRFGHEPNPLTLPLGGATILNASDHAVTIIEPVTTI